MNMNKPLISDGEALIGFTTKRNFPAICQLVDLKINDFVTKYSPQNAKD